MGNEPKWARLCGVPCSPSLPLASSARLTTFAKLHTQVTHPQRKPKQRWPTFARIVGWREMSRRSEV